LFAALAMYYIGIFMLYYLSRTREYLADTFCAQRVEGRHLASALVKIAYGIVKVEDTEATQSLVQSTRHMGVIDVKNARHVGLVAESDSASAGQTAEAMLFDYYNPWARLIELNSTHPLTGMRIANLGEVAKEKGQPFGDYDIPAAAARVHLDGGALWSQFWRELAILAASVGAAILVCLVGAWPLAPAAFAAAVIATLYVRYPSTPPQSTAVMALMTNPAASPVVGRPVRLEGTPIGRANPGFFAGEDIYQDKTGILAVDFRSMLGILGDLYTGWRRIPKQIGQAGSVTGWFRRSMGGSVILSEMTSPGGQLRARPYFWQMLLCMLGFAVAAGPRAILHPQIPGAGRGRPRHGTLDAAQIGSLSLQIGSLSLMCAFAACQVRPGRLPKGGKRRYAGARRWLAALIVAFAAAHSAHAGENLDGYWMDSDGEVILNIGPCGDARCGKVAWLKKPRGADGAPLRDYKNPDAKLQSRFVCGLPVVIGFKKQPDGTWGDGTVYVPDHGMSFSGYAEVLNPVQVKVSGYVLLPLFGSSEVWTRITRKPPSCEEQAKMIAAGRWTDDTSSWPPIPPAAARR
jgi:uncharacterized protein (DUF2147 family)